MSETKSPLGGLTRRGFLKTTGAVTAVAAVAGTGAALAPMPANAEGSSSADGEQTFRSACRGNCGSRCPLEVTVREGKVVKARPMDMPGEDAVRKRFCVKGFSQPQRVYDTDRLKYPMKRVGERGAGEWERASAGTRLLAPSRRRWARLSKITVARRLPFGPRMVRTAF